NPTQQILRISAVTRDDQGMYQCFAFNDNDMAQAAGQLTVSGMLFMNRYLFLSYYTLVPFSKTPLYENTGFLSSSP
ncbi:unnamed protein product, partial [Allacma fusca]